MRKKTNTENPASKTKYTAFRCPSDLLEKAKIKAKQQRRSLSNFIVCLLGEATEGKPANS